MLFPKPKTLHHKQKQNQSSSPRLPSLEMCSSSPLFRQVGYLFAIFRALGGATSAQEVMSNRRRFAVCFEELQRARLPHMDTNDMALFQGAQSLNSRHRDMCLTKVSMLKRTPGPGETLEATTTGEALDSVDNDTVITKGRHQGRRDLKIHYNIVLKDWIDHHTAHPFPTKEEKAELCNKTSITERQLNNWFTNYRRRHLH
ncbi:MAG: hypothetical protein J3R72DRAFT_492609 [Linnemannia gamsii]|nr:MAG: hypothetical protein J3R72DRAFT_492609 [Linnemannia gamsii]